MTAINTIKIMEHKVIKMRFQLITFMMYITSLIYLNIYYPYKMHLALIDENFWINTNIVIWINNISKLLFIMSLGFLIKKERLVINQLYPLTQ